MTRRVTSALFALALILTLALLAAPAHATDYGASYARTPHATEPVWAGKATVARIFDPNRLTVWGDYPEAQRAYDQGVRKFAFSWKGTDPDDIRTFAATVPAGVRIFGTYLHEPEDDIEQGRLTLEQWKARTITQAKVMREVGIVPTRVLMGWTLYPAKSGRNVADYDLPAGTVAISAFDAHVRDKNPAGMARRLLREQKRTGLPMAVPETSGRPANIAELKRRLDGRVRWACFFTYKRGMTPRQAEVWF